VLDLITGLCISADRINGTTIKGGSVFLDDRRDAHWATIQVSGTPESILALGEMLVSSARQMRADRRREQLAEWVDANPEQPTPLDHGGLCPLCGEETISLFTVRVPIGEGIERDTAEACAGCLHVSVPLPVAL
jgi:hypothetical protein